MSAQNPSDSMPSQPPADAAYHTDANPVTRNPPEFAVFDTPGTSGPYGAGTDYMDYRPAPGGGRPGMGSRNNSALPTPATRPGMNGRNNSTQPPPPPESSGIPSALARGIRGGGPANAREARGTQYTSAAGGSGGGGGGGGGGHPLRQKENANVDAEQMASAGEGKVAHAVEGAAEGARSSRRRRESSSQNERFHGRVRGEVTLDGDEADMERKKAQQSLAREQVKQDRREGKDVDGGSFGAQPRADIG
ncbi:hypothetical protein B0T17DRAFT_651998 [Bombardia bombarda]|uniref:Uncharacterized protein n=1 Tax=Bombardia bombarda TaxID=252184 RepID=A0AA39XNT1_9PEZI|nr:hypothetical protein B0T17DRAFT_651998 [Bombardia bombarda]